MTEQYANGAASTLVDPIDDDDTSLEVASGDGFPATGDFRILVAEPDGSDPELMLVTGVTGDVFTVTRGIEEYNGDDTPVAHAADAIVKHVLTVESLATFPFEGGGADLSAFRLPGTLADDPGDIPLGAFGDEFEYVNQTALEAIWTPTQSNRMYAAGSSAILHARNLGDGMILDATGFDATDWEVGFLVSGHYNNGDAFGIYAGDAGVGVAASPYNDGNTYEWAVGGGTPYQYFGTGEAEATAYTTWQDGRPVWLFLRKAGTTWRYAVSEDPLGGLTVIHADFTASPTITEVGLVAVLNAGGLGASYQVHRFVYATPDLGL